jgi:omega-hydroxy-beta-dihydromenaquinone-9 sulfotransferase
MKPHWRFWNNYLTGIPWERWRVLRAENKVDSGYRHRAAFLTLLSVRNSVIRRREEQRYGADIDSTRIPEAPTFVLGHWRSGSTHLHNLLACDRDHFAAPNSIHASFPYTFLSVEAEVRRQFAAFVPPTRPMDNVELGPDTPQEDEFAMCVSCLRSPFLGMCSFPLRAAHYDRYVSFGDASAEEVQEWRETFRWFLKKLTFKLRRPLLLKSPPHTARVRLLLELFPDARFVHIRRNPYAVFQSTRHLLARLWPIHTLQRPPESAVDSILGRYVQMYDAYFAERELIPSGRLCEVAYEALAEDPIREVRRVYEELSLPGFEALAPRLQAYLAHVGPYRGNEFAPLQPELHAKVTRAWNRQFHVWGYSADPT